MTEREWPQWAEIVRGDLTSSSKAMVRMQARRALKENRAKRLECWLTMGDDIRAHALWVVIEGVLNVPRRDSRGQTREIWVEGSV